MTKVDPVVLAHPQPKLQKQKRHGTPKHRSTLQLRHLYHPVFRKYELESKKENDTNVSIIICGTVLEYNIVFFQTLTKHDFLIPASTFANTIYLTINLNGQFETNRVHFDSIRL
jgi:hypothetical protein